MRVRRWNLRLRGKKECRVIRPEMVVPVRRILEFVVVEAVILLLVLGLGRGGGFEGEGNGGGGGISR